ncbi:hypothetical protein [Sphingobacterium zeae]|uniref:Multisubunit Na+/H+ antiporter MnhB subunit n=1 Tax=Sphingobacterium zeae TaxID=1776859 RepID=A0ABU0U4G1_9SPHI|nr:hypothetical protein [Sphingobacterium zeae]MDQ1149851.1 multisubunit Na+/H+ antiporter MnhB subunit [Sphingobacterium zeae]
MIGRMKRQRKGKFAFVFVAIIVGVFLLVALLQYLWNTLMVDIFNLKAITYWQALGLFVFSRILFGRGFGKPGGGRFRKSFPSHIEKEADLSEEERERLREEWKRRFSGRCGL